ncbi:MAG: hypothetical protein IPK52_04795 [Chloroflexi bacterium]|nr:hypothetical protein [Chloroflexota bacterium]
MKIRILFALTLAGLAAACGSVAGPSPEPTVEIRAEATAEATAVDPSWVVVRLNDPTIPGWEYQHPEGWEVVTLDGRNFFLYSRPGVGEHLFTTPLQPGEIAFQISLNVVANAEETATSHLAALTGTLRDTSFSEAQPVSISGMDGVKQTGTHATLGWTVTAISREFVRGQYIDIFAYSRTDELDLNLPTIDKVIETVSYALPTE